jgi:predicted nucleotidyltransferase
MTTELQDLTLKNTPPNILTIRNLTEKMMTTAMTSTDQTEIVEIKSTIIERMIIKSQ